MKIEHECLMRLQDVTCTTGKMGHVICFVLRRETGNFCQPANNCGVDAQKLSESHDLVQS